jgi:hypothetical protein
MRSCRVCGRREELDIDDGVNLAAWYPVWEGYAGAHFGRRKSRSAVLDSHLTTTGSSAGLSGQSGTSTSPSTTPNTGTAKFID